MSDIAYCRNYSGGSYLCGNTILSPPLITSALIARFSVIHLVPVSGLSAGIEKFITVLVGNGLICVMTIRSAVQFTW